MHAYAAFLFADLTVDTTFASPIWVSHQSFRNFSNRVVLRVAPQPATPSKGNSKVRKDQAMGSNPDSRGTASQVSQVKSVFLDSKVRWEALAAVSRVLANKVIKASCQDLAKGNLGAHLPGSNMVSSLKASSMASLVKASSLVSSLDSLEALKVSKCYDKDKGKLHAMYFYFVMGARLYLQFLDVAIDLL